MQKYLKLLFNPGEHVNFCVSSVKEVQAYSQEDVPPECTWVCVNPIKPGTTRRQANIRQFRNFVIECDDHVDMGAQLGLIHEYGVPFATAVFSGNKSVHFVIALDTPVSKEEYRALAKRMRKVLPWADSTCFEPARLTRCPKAGMQPMIAFGRRTTYEDVDKWLTERGAPRETARPSGKSHFLEGAMLTKRTMEFVAGLRGTETGHQDAIHAAKNMLEVGMEYDEVLDILTTTRLRYRPQETSQYARERTEKVVAWVAEEWNEEQDRAPSN